MMTGWQCPVCGSGVSPTVERCPCVNVPRVVTPARDVPDSIREFVRPPSPPDAASDDGWIEWAGGECPVRHIAPVKVKLRDGSINRFARDAGNYRWAHNNDNDDIIAYKVLP